MVCYCSELSDKANKIIYELGLCLNHFKYSDKKIESLLIEKDEISTWQKNIEGKLVGANTNRVILCLTKDLDNEYLLRDYLLKKNELFKVETLSQSEEFKYDCFRAHHWLLMLNQLNNGQAWIVNEIVEKSPIVVACCHF